MPANERATTPVRHLVSQTSLPEPKLRILWQSTANHPFRQSFAATQVTQIKAVSDVITRRNIWTIRDLWTKRLAYFGYRGSASLELISGQVRLESAPSMSSPWGQKIGQRSEPKKRDFARIAIKSVANNSTEIVRHHQPPQLEQSFTSQQVPQKSTTATKSDNRRMENGTQNENQSSHDWVAWR